MQKRPYTFLGHYLVGHGVISEAELKEALRLQKQNNALIGAIAVAQGFLDKTQLDYLVRQQADVDQRIGALAIDEGFMTAEQLDTVLAIQGANHLYLGEALLRLGTVSEETLNDALHDFQLQIVAQERQVKDELKELPTAQEALIALDVALRFFYRLGFPIRVLGTSDRLDSHFDHLYCSEQVFNHARKGYMGVGMKGALVQSIINGFPTTEFPLEHDPRQLEDMSQVIFNLNYMVCKAMRKLGIQAKHGAAFVELPTGERRNGVCLDLETVSSPMVLFLRPPTTR